eukprot:CAMPEP_0184664044 /NCGR_PEP_ID=MMETSP0308-20130426/50948_1 /TAXON_ID=38269 /ORGANISM="Gloeochaete witrockiana, Strain SAG 46.84" /LENGTH=74 /DNA_ID=CAMNT_0027107189 /DNA_START=315 /DNA_END=539 /DNA_ORIENTATION=-
MATKDIENCGVASHPKLKRSPSAWQRGPIAYEFEQMDQWGAFESVTHFLGSPFTTLKAYTTRETAVLNCAHATW